MNPLNQVTIEEKETIYNIKMSYHSERNGQDVEATITGVEQADGTVTIRPWGSENYHGAFFEFNHSDPDRAIAIAQMIAAFAQMVKNNKRVDTENNL